MKIPSQLIARASVLRALLSGVGDAKVAQFVLNFVAKRSRLGCPHCWNMRLIMSWWSDHSVGSIWPALDRSSSITFILPGMYLAQMDRLCDTASKNKDSVSFQRDQDRVPPTLLINATTVVLSEATRMWDLVGKTK